MKITSTLSGQKEEFIPQGDEVKMYVCGVTPHSEAHIGHAMSYIIFDVIRRYLEFRGYKVKYVQNFTDIDDKIINGPTALGISVTELAEKYTAELHRGHGRPEHHAARTSTPAPPRRYPRSSRWSRGWWTRATPIPPEGSVYFRVTQARRLRQAVPPHARTR